MIPPRHGEVLAESWRPVTVDAEQLRRELRRLRASEGRTLGKLLGSPAVRAALGDPPEAELVTAFDAAVLALGNDLKSLALKHAYAIGFPQPDNLTKRREAFAAQPPVSRAPDTVSGWEDEALAELAAQLLAGGRRVTDELLVAVAIDGTGRIMVVAEGAAMSGEPMRSFANPVAEPFLPGFIYRLPPFARPRRLTLGYFFVADRPTRVDAEASGDLLAFMAGEGRQELDIVDGGIPGFDATAHAVVHYGDPLVEVFYGARWVVS